MEEGTPPKKRNRYLSDQKRIEEALAQGVHLRNLIPIRYRKVFKKCFWSVLFVFTFWGVASVFVLRFITENNRLEAYRYLWAAWIAVLLVGLLWATGTQLIYYMRYFYDIDDRSFMIRKGIIGQSEITLPFSKITDVYVNQDSLDVLFGLYDVHISSPTQSSGELAHIDGLDKRGAVLIRSIVLERIHKEVDAMATNPSPEPTPKFRPLKI